MKACILFFITLISSFVYGQNESKRVLFLGNSYTSSNNLTQLIANMATSIGDTLEWEMVAPGGYYLYDHSVSATSINKIESGNWDYVVLQDQSQATTLPETQMALGYSTAHVLDSIINVHNPCAETMFYMTWGRKNGDSFFHQIYAPWYAEDTYEFMDSLIHTRYMFMSNENNTEVSPVGAVWKYIRQNYPNIELYQPDESHPSLTGSYLAACCFYTSLFRKDPTLISYNSSLSVADANTIKDAVKLMVYDSLSNWNIGVYDSLNNIACPTANLNVVEENETALLQITPNPATSQLIIKFASENIKEQILMYNSSGVLIREIEGLATTEIDIKTLPNGLYFIRLKNYPNKAFKFLKI